jgi:23S rRNA (adenine1618-N6)-methyltransferase
MPRRSSAPVTVSSQVKAAIPTAISVVKKKSPTKEPQTNADPVAVVQDGLHPRSRHHGAYDFAVLTRQSPALKPYVMTNRFGNRSIDFAIPAAVKALNQALMLSFYNIKAWDIPAGYLCPPIPGRADYLHHLADLLATGHRGNMPPGEKISALDIGVGASAIYPLIGHRLYGWRFVGSDCDVKATESARRIVRANEGLEKVITIRTQQAAQTIFHGVVKPDEHFEVSLCNPPFHASAEEAAAGTRRKWLQLGKTSALRQSDKPVLNFGGKATELWCPGGEVGFISRMIQESAELPNLCLWFTSLVAKETSMPAIVRSLKQAHVRERRVFELTHGQKRSRIIAWTFLDERQRKTWRDARWGF